MPTPPTDAMRRVAEEYSDLPGRSRVSDAHLAGQVKGRADAAELLRAEAAYLKTVGWAVLAGKLLCAADDITRGDWETDE